MLKDAQVYVNLCDKCQRHWDMHLAPPAELTSLVSPWPFAWWGIDLLGPFPKAAGQLKYPVVSIEYSTKWIEAEPLAKITAKNVLRFLKRNILARFGVPNLVISDNGTQFTDQRFQDYLRNIGIKQSFTSVEHPQATASSKQQTGSFYKEYEEGWTQPKLNGLKSCTRSSRPKELLPTPLLASHLFDSRTGQRRSYPLS